MRDVFRAELDRLVADLSQLMRLATSMMQDASRALLEADLGLAERVISSADECSALRAQVDERCVQLLALQAPVASDLRMVVTALHAVQDLTRMATLTQHIAGLVRLKHPAHVVPPDVSPVFDRMGQLAVNISEAAADAVSKQDPTSADRLDATDDEVDSLRRKLFRTLFADEWAHGVEPAVDAALLGRYYERFADHAVAVARQVNYLVTGDMSHISR